MKVHISELIVGDRLASEIFNDHGTFVFPAFKSLSEEDIERLKLFNIEYVHILRRMTEDPEAILKGNPRNIQRVLPYFSNAVLGFKNMYDQVQSNSKVEAEQIDRDLKPLLNSLKEENDVISLLITLNTLDDYTYQHSVQVGMISYFIAKWLGMSEQEAFKVGKAGYLHDIGKSKIDPKILQKPAKLTYEEYEEVKKHPIYGYEIINSFPAPDHTAATVALQHHERVNGSGYPYGLPGHKIHPIAKIIAVADIYSAMVSSRAYQKKQDFLKVLKELHHLSFSQIDPVVTQTFIKHMIPNFIGKKVTLKSGDVGVIIMNNQNDYFHPLIQVDHQFIDLSSNREHEIEMIYIWANWVN